MDSSPVEQHSVWKSLLLHLLPGLLITFVYLAAMQPLKQMGYPSFAALMLAIVLALIPFELGVLLYVGKKKNGRLSLKGVLSYRSPIPVWQYFLWVPAVFVLTGLIFTFLKPVDVFLQQNVFGAWPVLDAGLSGGYSKSVLVVTYVLVGLLSTVAGPVVEELYFRGYLLPRMGYAGKWAPLLHSFLFALYHFFTPWMMVTRTAAMLPMIFAVQKKNLNISIIVHILGNLMDLAAGVAFIAAMT